MGGTCDRCDREAVMSINGEDLCEKHYVEEEPKACLEQDLALSREQGVELDGKLVEEIEEKYPGLGEQ